jgi:hypothetical protein
MIGEDDKIDVIGEDDNEIVLAISDHWSWDGSDGIPEETHVYKLQDKLNSYLSYIESGEISEKYDIEGKKIIIEIYNKYPFSQLAEDFIRKSSEIVKKAGFELRANNSLIGQ